jgi:hypothetical protein
MKTKIFLALLVTLAAGAKIWQTSFSAVSRMNIKDGGNFYLLSRLEKNKK